MNQPQFFLDRTVICYSLKFYVQEEPTRTIHEYIFALFYDSVSLVRFVLGRVSHMSTICLCLIVVYVFDCLIKGWVFVCECVVKMHIGTSVRWSQILPPDRFPS